MILGCLFKKMRKPAYSCGRPLLKDRQDIVLHSPCPCTKITVF